MPPLRRPTFVRQVRRLDRDAFGRFVADLWDSRGWETQSEGDLIVATRDGPRVDQQVLCLGSTDPVEATGGQSRCDALVTRTRREADADPTIRVIDGDDLYEIALYGIDRTTLDELCRRHFGAPAAGVGRRWMPDPSVRPPRALTDRVGSGTTLRLAGIVLLAAALVIASGSAVVFDGGLNAGSSASNGGNAAAATPPDPETPTPVPIRVRRTAMELTCAPPPSDAAPAKLRPGVISHASSHGLEGWEIISEQTISNFPGPNAVPTPQVPQEKYLGSYRNPKDRYYRLDISRWESPSEADLVADAMDDEHATWVPWGRYTVAISAFNMNGTAVTDASTAASTRMLLAGVERADGPKIGEACVSALLNRDGPPTPAARPPREG